MTEQLYKQISLGGILPVVVLDEARHGVPLAQALARGGIRQMEVTFRTDAARDAIAAITRECPGTLVGAGTVTSRAMAKTAVEAGARFIVSPGLDEDIVRWCQEEGIPVLPGIATPTEAQAAVRLGLNQVKVYPAQQLGGVDYLRSLASVFGNLRFLPSGGIDHHNLCSYLDQSCVLAASGSWICPRDMIRGEQFQEIEALARGAVEKMLGFHLLHIGVNSRDGDEAKDTASRFCQMFGLPLIQLAPSFFAGTMMEVLKSPFLGEHGHIAISTNYMDRALAHFESRGYKFRDVDPSVDPKDLVAVYFQEEIGGFAIHLRRRLEQG